MIMSARSQLADATACKVHYQIRVPERQTILRKAKCGLVFMGEVPSRTHPGPSELYPRPARIRVQDSDVIRPTILQECRERQLHPRSDNNFDACCARSGLMAK